MRRRIRRKSPLGQTTLAQAENLLTSSMPPEMRQVLCDLQTNLREVHSLIDQQLQKTRSLSARAYADLRSPVFDQSEPETSSVASDVSGSSIPSVASNSDETQVDASPNPAQAQVQHQLSELNQRLHQKFAAMTQQIAARSQQVSAQADAMHAYAQQAGTTET